MTKLLLMLLAAGVMSGCVFQDPTGPTEGPEGQSLEEYNGKDSEGNRIMYEFYLSGADTVKHGDYWVYFDGGPERFWVEFREGKRHGFEKSYVWQDCSTETCRDIAGDDDTDYWQNDKCVGQGYRKCEGDEYDGY